MEKEVRARFSLPGCEFSKSFLKAFIAPSRPCYAFGQPPLDCGIAWITERPTGYILNNNNFLPELHRITLRVYFMQKFLQLVIILLCGNNRIADICVYSHTSPNLSSSHSTITTSAVWIYKPFSLAWLLPTPRRWTLRKIHGLPLPCEYLFGIIQILSCRNLHYAFNAPV